MKPAFRLLLFGECKLLEIASDRAVEFRNRKTRCLLGLLALSPGGECSRDRLAGMLWDSSAEEQARSSLRQCLKEIRDILGDRLDEIVTIDRLMVALRLDRMEIDVVEFRRGLERARDDAATAARLAALWRGELFGDALPAAPTFEAWVQIERSHIRSQLSLLLTGHLERILAAGDYSSAVIPQELIRIEPSHELAHQFMMAFHARRGDQASALRQFASLEQALAVELDSEPSQGSLDLLVAVKRGDYSETRAGPQPKEPQAGERLPGPPAIIVRPARTRSANVSKDYLSEGFTNLTRSCLSRFRSWVILSWPSRGFEQSAEIDYEELGRVTGANYVLDSLIDWRQMPGTLAVSLIDCSTGLHVWSDTLPIEEASIQDASSNVVGRVGSSLASHLNYVVLRRFARAGQVDAAAYDTWLRGHQLTRAWEADADRQALALFERAIELDPGLACAYASMASILCTRGIVTPCHPETERDRERAFALAQRALSLDPFDSRNHINAAWNLLMEGSTERATSHFKLAVDLNPFDSETLIASSQGAAFVGDHDSARKWADRAIELNPLYPPYFAGYLAVNHLLAGRHGEALAAARLAKNAFPNILAWTAAAQALTGDVAGAHIVAMRFLDDVSKRWAGPTPPTAADMLKWFLQAIPIADPIGRNNLEKGLRMAVAPVTAAVTGSA